MAKYAKKAIKSIVLNKLLNFYGLGLKFFCEQR